MSDTLVAQMSDLFAAVDERQHPIELAEILNTVESVGNDGSASTDLRRWAWRSVVLVAAAVIIVVLIVTLPGSDEGRQEINVADEVETRLPDIALAVAGDYFDAFNSGDADALFALLTPDAIVDTNRGPTPPGLLVEFRRFWDDEIILKLAQGSTLTTPQCEVTDETPGRSATVSCKTTERNAAIEAAGSPPVKAILTVEVTPAGIIDLYVTYGALDFGDIKMSAGSLLTRGVDADGEPLVDFTDASEPFHDWVSRNRPDAVDALEQNGTLVAELAKEWADYLEANNCNYRDNC